MKRIDHKDIIGLIALLCNYSGGEHIHIYKYYQRGSDQIEK